jgi:hypothetical protein
LVEKGNWVDWFALDANLIVQMGCCAIARPAYDADDPPHSDFISGSNRKLFQVAINGGETLAMIDANYHPIPLSFSGETDHPIRSGNNSGSG